MTIEERLENVKKRISEMKEQSEDMSEVLGIISGEVIIDDEG